MIFNSCLNQICNDVSLFITNNNLFLTLHILDFDTSYSFVIQLFQLLLLWNAINPNLFFLFLLSLNQLGYTTKQKHWPLWYETSTIHQKVQLNRKLFIECVWTYFEYSILQHSQNVFIFIICCEQIQHLLIFCTNTILNFLSLFVKYCDDFHSSYNQLFFLCLNQKSTCNISKSFISL